MKRFFTFITDWPKTILFLSLVFIIVCGANLTKIYKDVSTDAFIDPHNPILIYKNKVKEIFGLAEPIVVAIINENGIYNQESLELVADLTAKIERLPNVDPDKVTSLATMQNIYGTEDGMVVEDLFVDGPPKTPTEIKNLEQAIDNFPLYQGSLVARDKTATLIVAELLDEAKAEHTYEDVMAIVNALPKTMQSKIYVAGEGAIVGYTGKYIDDDAKFLDPIAALIIAIILFICYRTISSVLMSYAIVIASLVGAIGIMAAVNVPFYLITNAMVVILIGISVADSIHIFGQYYEEQANNSELPAKDIVIKTFVAMFQPITLTTLTTMAGFIGLYLASEMPPFKYMGLFSALGVLVAWIYSVCFLPALLTLVKPKGSKIHKISAKKEIKIDKYANFMQILGKVILKFPKVTVFISISIILLGIFGASKIIVNDALILIFHKDEPIAIANKKLNKVMDGTNIIDIVIETNQSEDLFIPENLKKIENLQNFANSLSVVGGSVSVVDYIKQMYKALNENNSEFYKIPDNKELIAQLFLLYTASASPDDFEEEIDYDYRLANVRLNLNNGEYMYYKGAFESIEKYINEEFNSDTIKAHLSGRVTLNHHWVKTMANSHLLSICIALFLVYVVSIFLFRSVTAGTFTMIPIITAVMLVYAVMGVLNISLSVGTSMFASVAIGLGVDFAIHTIHIVKKVFQARENKDFDTTMLQYYNSTGRALLFNFLAVGLSFGCLTISKVVPLFNFGLIVFLAVLASFLASTMLLPALIKISRPNFIPHIKN